MGTVLDWLEAFEAQGFDTDRALDLTVERGLDQASVKMNHRLKTTAGRAKYLPKPQIELNPKLSEEGELATWQTFIHELAHLISPDGHGRRWKATYRAMGGNGERCHSYETMRAQRQTRKLVAWCPECGVEFYRARALPRNGKIWRCRRCRCEVVRA